MAAFISIFLSFMIVTELCAQMMGAAPATGKKPAAKNGKQAPVVESTELETTTAKDYSYYLKSGHKSPKWNEFIEPAFQTFDSENMSTASIFMQRAYDQGCRDPLLLFRYGIYLESKGKYNDAAELLLETADGVKKRYPSHPLNKSIYKHTGRTLYHVGRYSEALTQLTEALKIQNDDFMLLFMSGQILHHLGELQKARFILEKAALSPPPMDMAASTVKPLLHELILITSKMGDMVACEIYVNQLLTFFPDDPMALQHRRELTKMKNKAREREILKNIIQ